MENDIELEDIDENILKSHKWALEFKDSILKFTEKYIMNWCKTVIDLGENQIDLEKWKTIYTNQVKEIHEDLFRDVNKMKQDTIEKIVELIQRLREIKYDLGMDNDDFHTDINTTKNVYLAKQILTSKANEFEELYNKKKEEFNSLLEQHTKLCNLLEESPTMISEDQPMYKQIEELKQQVESLENIQYKRVENYTNLKESILKMASQLDLTPKSDFERDVLNTDMNQEFNLSRTNMQELEQFHADLENRLLQMREEIDNLRKTAEYLWSVLDESISERESFLSNHQGYSVQTLKALQAEVKRCEDSKRANIKIFVERAKKEIKELWKLCYHTQDTKEDSWFNCDMYTEDLLDLFELELAKWRNFYSSNEELLKLFKEHQKLWDLLHILENADSDGMNRYKNRGGQLLKEEKERNKLHKNIPKIEEKIKELSQQYEEMIGKPFRVFNQPILQYIDTLHYQRDEEKKLKLSARKQKPTPMKERTTPAKSCVSLFSSTSKLFTTPRSAVRPTASKTPLTAKRTISSAKTADRKLIKPTTASIQKAKDKLNSSGVSPANRSRRLSKERNKRILRCKKYLDMASKKNKENLDITNYDTFEKNLSTRDDNCRSTLHGNHRTPDTSLNETFLIPAIVLIPSTPGSAKKLNK